MAEDDGGAQGDRPLSKAKPASAVEAVEAVDAGEVAALGRALVREEVVYFPVRHHSPACAWHLQRLIGELRPGAILIEGPSSFDALIPLIVDERAKAPLAVYSYCVQRVAKEAADEGKGRYASYYPLCDYSPELVAMREGTKLGCELRFIDLDYGAQCALEAPEDTLESLLDERRWRDSRYLHALAERCGCRDHDELWDHLFECTHRDVSTAEFMARLAAYCMLIRRETPAARLEVDGTLAREAEMAWHVEEALKARAARPEHERRPVLVVTGGFHTVALATGHGEAAKRPKVPAATVEQQSALIRYSFERLDRLNGYSAGMPSPAWHQALWSARAGRGEESREVALETFFAVAERLRKEADRPGTTLLVAALEQAERLAALRGRPRITRAEVIDAILGCFVKGAADAEGAPILATTLSVLAGNAIGTLPPGTGVPPLVRDFQHRARRQRLKIDDSERRKLTLEIYRRTEHRRTSRMLHGLSLLGVPFAIRVAGPDFVRGAGLERLQEHWEYSYSPATEAALVEAGVYGSTLSEAVASKFAALLAKAREAGGGRSASAMVGKLSEALVLGLHDFVARITVWLREAVALDPELVSMAQAAAQLDLLQQSREPLEAEGIEDLGALLHAAYERACFLLAQVAATPADTEQEVAMALLQLRELLAGADRNGLDPALYWDALARVADDPRCGPFIAGAATGLLFATARVDEIELAKRIEGRLQGAADAREAVAYLGGMLTSARETAWQVPALLEALDRRLAAWSHEEFVRMLPDMRLMFAGMTPQETDRIAEAAASLHGSQSLGRLVSHDVSEVEMKTNLLADATVRAALRVDGLEAWLEQAP